MIITPIPPPNFLHSCDCCIKILNFNEYSWEWPRLHLCLLYLRAVQVLIGVWAVGRVNNELLLKLTPVFMGVREKWISLAASLPLLHSEKLTGRCSPWQLTEVKPFLSSDWGGAACGRFPFLPGTLGCCGKWETWAVGDGLPAAGLTGERFVEEEGLVTVKTLAREKP